MRRQQQWSTEEATVLLDGLLQVINSGSSRAEVIKQVSSNLRMLASLRGQEIDDVFRNENGIAFQLASMESAYYGKTIMKPATKLFIQVVELHRNNKQEFERVLKGAMDMLDNKVIGHEESFMNWLSKQVSPMQLSELYSTYKEIEEFCLRVKTINTPLFSSVDYIRAKKVKNTIETNKVFRFSHRRHMAKFIAAATHFMHYCKSMAEVADEMKDQSCEKVPGETSAKQELDEGLAQKYPIIYKNVKAIVSARDEKLSASAIKNQIGSIARLTDIEYILSNASWGYQISARPEEFIELKAEVVNDIANTYFSPIKTKSSVSAEKSGEAIKNCDDVILISEKIVAKNKFSEEKEFDSTHDILPINQSVTLESKEVHFVDFTSSIDYSYSLPLSFTYFDEKHQDLRSWTDLYVKLFTCLYEDYPHVLKPGMSFSGATGGRIELTTEDQQSIMFAPKKIADTDLVLETNISASNMISKIRFWLELCNVDFENVEILYVKKAPVSSLRRTEERSKVIVPSVKIPVADEKYKAVLQDRFKKGYRLVSGLDLKKFKRYYHEIHGTELSEDDSAIAAKIRNCGIVHEEKLFVPETMLSNEARDKLFSYIADEFAQGKKTLYYEALFRAFSEQFLDYYIYDVEMLKSYLAYYNEGKYHISANYIAKECGVSAKPYDEIKDYLIGAGVPVDAEVICAVLSHIPSKKIMQILGMNAEFVYNGKSHYFHVSVVNLSQEELVNIATLISKLIQEKEFISGNELISAIRVKYPYIIDNNQSFSSLGMRDAIKYNLQDCFSFTGNVISGKGKWMSMADVFASYAKSRSEFDIAELVTLAEEMNSTIYFEKVYDNALRISQSRFVSKDQAQFHVHETDLAIDRFCSGKYIPIKAVTEFGSFPDAGFQWNPYLLANYVYAFSKQYRLLTAGFNKNTCVGAIVSRSSEIETFDDFLATALAEGNCELKKVDALNFLVDQGYLARRSYSNIEKILIQAKAQRNMKGTD